MEITSSYLLPWAVSLVNGIPPLFLATCYPLPICEGLTNHQGLPLSHGLRANEWVMPLWCAFLSVTHMELGCSCELGDKQKISGNCMYLLCGKGHIGFNVKFRRGGWLSTASTPPVNAS
ncbi:hypothetical protein I7I50_00387 [Histoplasma capsulatum G186AR]|uniref:Uncharacterized protein n=1 Tax=Ajellomyces capsulatus TaxID=5037 RepID=A0A8H7YIW9_AJECA|nr:hypothetical protein I7I52_07655 [Histoplasma capsulatum]QSS72520.1 hypothetical protein I7I50_00387 [Histoplasma capsulatum G186AR]